jgi:apoptotic chromatin condensation inducer in the nucleus
LRSDDGDFCSYWFLLFAVTMSSFPVLKNRPIDQWKVTELKDELRKRRLPVKGLKEELVRRLFDSIKSEEASDESAEDVGANEAVDEGAIDVEANAPVDNDAEGVGVNEPVDQAPEEHTVRHKTTVSVTEVCQETVVHATQEITLPLPEDSHNVVASHESLSTEAQTVKGDEPESVDGENSTVQEGHPHTVLVAEETPEVGTNETIVAGDVTTADLQSDATRASNADKQDKVPTPVDGADPMDTDVAAASVNSDAEKVVPENELGNNSLTNNEEFKDSELTNEDCKPIVSKSSNQVPEISPDLGSPIK